MALSDEELQAIVETLSDDERKQLPETLQSRVAKAYGDPSEKVLLTECVKVFL